MYIYLYTDTYIQINIYTCKFVCMRLFLRYTHVYIVLCLYMFLYIYLQVALSVSMHFFTIPIECIKFSILNIAMCVEQENTLKITLTLRKYLFRAGNIFENRRISRAQHLAYFVVVSVFI